MAENDLTPDCARCAGLCCVAFPFERSEAFAIDKPAGVPCPHLSADHRCSIHAERAARGFGGCIHFDCHGAGQTVTQVVFDGRSWRDDPELLTPMLAAFAALRRINEQRLLLGEATKLPLSPSERSELEALQAQLHPAGGWTEDALSAWGRSDAPVRLAAFFVGLRRYVSR